MGDPGSSPRARLRAATLKAAVVAALGAAVVAVVLAGGADARRSADLRRAPGPWCGGTLWRLMTLSDPGRISVDLRGTPTTIAEIARQTRPRRIGARRATPFQRRVWKLETVLDRYRIASNGEIVLILYSIKTSQYMNAYMPNPNCLSFLSRDRTGIVAARRGLEPCPAPTPQWFLIGATVEIAGVGFWNPVRTTRGALANGAELRPVTNFRIIGGCGIG